MVCHDQKNRRRLFLTVLVLVLAGSACHRMFEHDEKVDDDPSRGRHIRLLDPEGAVLGSYRVRSRSAIVYDEIGIPIARALALPDQVVVRDRAAQVVLTITPRDALEESEGTGSVAELANGDSEPLGFLAVWPGERVVRSSVRQADLAEMEVHIRDDSEVAEVYGAEGTDLVLRVYSVAPNRIEVANLSGDIIAQFVGARLDTWIAASLGMDGPLAGEDGQAFFRVGLLAYLRQF